MQAAEEAMQAAQEEAAASAAAAASLQVCSYALALTACIEGLPSQKEMPHALEALFLIALQLCTCLLSCRDTDCAAAGTAVALVQILWCLCGGACQ